MQFKDIWEKIISPKKWFAILMSIVGVIVIAVTVTLVALGYTNNVLGYILYALSAVSLTYIVYLIVYYYKSFKNGILSAMQKYKFTRQLLENYGFRSVVFAVLSFTFNIAYAVFHGVIAILSSSIWLGSLALYYIVICCIRGVLLKRARGNLGDADDREHLELYRNSGVTLLILNLALIPAIVQIVVSNGGFEYAGLMIYVMATYTFYKLILSIYNLFRARRLNNCIIQAIKNIGFADSLVSILALQTALLSAFGNGGNMGAYNGLTGGVISLAIIAIGIVMIVRSQRKINNLEEESTNE